MEVLLGAVFVLVCAGAGGMLVRPAREPDQTLKARLGDVKWNHELHARMKEISNCTVCHHTEHPGVTTPKPCRDCHALPSNRDALVIPDLYMDVVKKEYSGENGPPAMEAFHKRCLGCHRALKKGPLVCRDCHAQSFSGKEGMVEWDHREHARGMNGACTDCHHKDRNAANDGDYRACGVCHEPAEVMGLPVATGIRDHEGKKHGECYTCHTRFNPERDERTCKDCHPGLEPSPATLVEGGPEERPPSVEYAVHTRCRKCHDPFSPEYRPGMPVSCTDCHKPDPSLITDPAVGPVLFSHKRHGEYETWTCDRCHHTDVPGEPHTACYRCHGTGHFQGIPGLAEAMEKRCLGCHEEKGTGLFHWDDFKSTKADLQHYRFEGKEGHFTWDHRFHAVSLALSCRDCHHNALMEDGRYVTGLRTGKEWPEEAGRIQTCRNCHGEAGPVPGSIAEGTEAKSLEEVFKKACVTCHQRLECGPRDWSAFFRKGWPPGPEGAGAGADQETNEGDGS